MTDDRANLDPSSWDPALDAVVAAPKHHKVVFENERLRVLEVTLEPNDEEPVHHHRWPSVFVFDQVQGPIHDIAPNGTQLPPNRDVIKAIEAWDGQGCLVVNMAPQPAGRVLNASGKTIHGIRVEMKSVRKPSRRCQSLNWGRFRGGPFLGGAADEAVADGKSSITRAGRRRRGLS